MSVTRPLVSALIGLVLTAIAAPASAAWLGLDDGDYVVSLHCDFSSVIACPGNTPGTMTLAGGQVTQMNVTIGGDVFDADPFDGVFDGTLVDTESSTIGVQPDFRFLSLRLITDGQIGSYGVGDRWWVYCNNSGPDQCTPNTTGLWSARLVGQVSEPALPALLLVGGAAAAAVRRRRG